jgi:hypothetical protein
MRWARHVARMVERTAANRKLLWKPKGKNHLAELHVGGRIILKWIFNKIAR